jgi:hypothetical protein
MGNSNLSGKGWWRANQGSYPNSKDVGDLEPGFRSRVEDFIGSLKAAGAVVAVNSTRRNAIRAHLMHYSWKIAYGEVDPGDVPSYNGLTIEWDHGDADKSRAAAREMVELFGMAHIASLRSNHIAGKAIDMNINWKGLLEFKKSGPLLMRIVSTPRTGQNRHLHEIGATVFGVRKLRSDPPHWSHNGR